MTGSFEDRARDVTVLGRANTVMGIPMNHLVFVVMTAIPITTMVSTVVGLLIGALALFALYRIHEIDPQGVDVWVDRIRSLMSGWRAGEKTRRTVIVITRGEPANVVDR